MKRNNYCSYFPKYGGIATWFTIFIFYQIKYCITIESMKTTSMETVSTSALDKNKEHDLRSKDKAEKSCDI